MPQNASQPPQRPFFVVNPRSGGGKTGAVWQHEILPHIREHFPNARWALTTLPAQAGSIARSAWEQGADLVVATGGDGTINECVNGFFAEPSRLLPQLPLFEGCTTWDERAPVLPQPRLGVLPAGTGCDLIKSLGIPRTLSGALEILKNGQDRLSDVGRIALSSEGGTPKTHWFLNVGGCGASGHVVRHVNAGKKSLGPKLTFYAATVKTIFENHRPKVRITLDHTKTIETDLQVLFVCNAIHCGGGMRIGQGAHLDDGLFKVIVVQGMSRTESLLKSGKLYSGELEGVSGISVYEARTVAVEASAGGVVYAECDGEMPGVLPALFEVVPKAVFLRCGQNPHPGAFVSALKSTP